MRLVGVDLEFEDMVCMNLVVVKRVLVLGVGILFLWKYVKVDEEYGKVVVVWSCVEDMVFSQVMMRRWSTCL